MSITDHDTVDGIEAAGKECEKQKIRFIPGIEFTTETEFPGIEIHILGYGFDPEDDNILEITDQAKINARHYCRQVCSRLESFGWEMDYSLIENTRGIITKHDITRSVCNKKISNYDFHNKWLSENSPLDVVMQKFPAKKVIKTIQKAGGKAICAHIMRTLEQTNDLPLLTYISESLIRSGLDGFEVFYANSNRKQVNLMFDLCSKKELIMTGGSDFHGPGRTGRCQLGQYNNYSMFRQKELIEQLHGSLNSPYKQKNYAKQQLMM